MALWIFSDSHFYHRNIIEYCGRPSDHNERMWENLKAVQEDDTLIHLGDVAWGGRKRTHPLVDRLPGGRKVLVEGNHDKRSKTQRAEGWSRVIRPVNQPLVLSGFTHYDMQAPDIYLAHRPKDVPPIPGAICIHGHTHEKGVPVRWHEDCLVINACVEQWDYKPIRVFDILKIWFERT